MNSFQRLTMYLSSSMTEFQQATRRIVPFPDAYQRLCWVLAERGPVAPYWRVTLAPAVIRAAREVIFLVTGREKAPALHHALEGAGRPGEAPTRVVLPPAGVVRWLVDSGAAAGLSGAGSESA